MINEESLCRNVVDIEFKCNELILEIDEHLSFIPCADNNDNFQLKKTEQLDSEDQPSKLFVLTCHNKTIDFRSGQERQTKSKHPVSISKELCNSITKINHSFDDSPNHNRSLQVQHLEHINIKPKLTKQLAFQISCPEHQAQRKNIGTFNVFHPHDHLKQPMPVNVHETFEENEQNDETFQHMKNNENEIRHFLYNTSQNI